MKNNKGFKILSLVLAMTMLLGLLAGCGSGDSGKKTGDLKDMTVVLDWYPNALHTFIYTAIERGYYAEEGLNVHVQFPANDNDAIALVSAGKAEIGLYYEHDVIQAVANQGVKVKSIGAVVQTPLNVILSLKDKNITKPEDLVGKTVGYGGTALSEALVRTMTCRHVDDAVAYCFQTLRRVAIDTLRHRLRHAPIGDRDIADSGEGASDGEMLERVMRLRNELPRVSKTLVVLHDQKGYTYDDIAALTGLSKMTVRRKLKEAHETMRQELEDEL